MLANVMSESPSRDSAARLPGIAKKAESWRGIQNMSPSCEDYERRKRFMSPESLAAVATKKGRAVNLSMDYLTLREKQQRTQLLPLKPKRSRYAAQAGPFHTILQQSTKHQAPEASAMSFLPAIPNISSRQRTQILRTNLVQGATIQSLLEYHRLPDSRGLERTGHMKHQQKKLLDKYAANVNIYNHLKEKLHDKYKQLHIEDDIMITKIASADANCQSPGT